MSFFENYINKFVINIKKKKSMLYTLYSSGASKLPSNIRSGIIVNIDNANKKLIDDWYYNGDKQEFCIIPGGTGVMLNGLPGNY